MENKENMKFDFVVVDETSDPPEVAVKIGLVRLYLHSYLLMLAVYVVGDVCTGLA